MTVARSVADVLADHVRFEVESIDRMYLNVYQRVLTRIWQRVLVLTAVVWHNDNIGAPIKRSLIAYDH